MAEQPRLAGSLGLPLDPRQLRMFVLMKPSAQAIITQTFIVCLQLDSSARLSLSLFLCLLLLMAAQINGAGLQAHTPAPNQLFQELCGHSPGGLSAKPARLYDGARRRDFQPSSELFRSIFPRM